MNRYQKIIAGVYKTDYTKIKERIMEADVVSFDMYDTLVRRNVRNPEDIFELVEMEFRNLTGRCIKDYKKIRCECELLAREKSKEDEILFTQIFENMENVSQEDREILKKLEIQYELELSCFDEKVMDLYKFALSNEKRIIITSDMYLDEAVIKKILYKCGYDKFEKLYLSASYGLCKSTGSIYDEIKKDYSALQEKILHIGDHVKSDYVIPKRKGLAALLIARQRNSLKYWSYNGKTNNKLLYGSLYSFLNNHLADECSDAVHIAYEILGPMILGYCTWLHRKIESNNIEKIFFLSREGKILQEAYNILYPQSKIPQTYLYVSRQALVVPLLADAKDFDEMINTLKCFLRSPFLNIFCTVCGLNSDKFQDKLAEVGLSLQTKIHEIPNNKKEEVYTAIKDLGECFFIKQKEYVSIYLKENDFFGNIAIVDIGWSGTMQNALQKYTDDSDTILHGYYLGVRNMEMDDYYDSMVREGYLFEPGKNEDYDLMVRFTTEILEMLLLNREGSVRKYVMKKNCIFPILTESEYKDEKGDFLESIQSHALFFLNSVKEDLLRNENIEIAADIPMASYSNFAIYPKMHTINIFEKFCFLNAGEIRNFLPVHGIFYYIFHLWELKRELNVCPCKIFYLKKIFKIKFPYFIALKFLVKKCNVKTAFRRRYY